VGALKRALKNRGKTYSDVAAGLDMSEASMKRMFSSNNFTLQRLEAVCHFIDLEFSDLVRLADEAKNRISHLTESQEKELVSNPRLMLVALCARNNWQFEDIIDYYDISETECIGHLAKLDQIKLIELLPGNRFRLLIRPDFRWLSDGPIERFYSEQIQREFFSSAFARPDEERLFLTGALSRNAIEQLLRKLNNLAKEFAELHSEDMSLPMEERNNFGLVLALRPWELGAFSSLKRKDV
jgi:DNA-binding Xre family transcriptional regulator